MPTALPKLDFLEALRSTIDEALDAALPPVDAPPARLVAAMRYAVLTDGKRLRPSLTLLTGEFLGAPRCSLLAPACAIEFIHAYSLIHDDLPSMDDDDLRRGRPSCHRAFDEATAILAGDALNTLAFEILATAQLTAKRRLDLIRTLAAAAGWQGMVGGQQLDLEATGGRSGPTDADRLKDIHARKTAALLGAATRLGAQAAGAGARVVEPVTRFGQLLGLCFQAVDDILDQTLTAEQLGKTPGKDARADKLTAPAALGLARARDSARELGAAALRQLDPFPAAGGPLRNVVHLVLERL